MLNTSAMDISRRSPSTYLDTLSTRLINPCTCISRFFSPHYSLHVRASIRLSAMVLHGLLPRPVPADEVSVGQLLVHPLHPERDGFYSEQAHEEIDDLNDYHIQL